jgi:hypothetical protein
MSQTLLKLIQVFWINGSVYSTSISDSNRAEIEMFGTGSCVGAGVWNVCFDGSTSILEEPSTEVDIAGREVESSEVWWVETNWEVLAARARAA